MFEDFFLYLGDKKKRYGEKMFDEGDVGYIEGGWMEGRKGGGGEGLILV